MKRHRIFYGWWIVVSAFTVLCLANAAGFYSFSLFVKPIQDDLLWTRGDLMLAFTLWSFASGGASPFVGRLVDRFGPARVIAAGAFLCGISLASLYFVNDRWLYYVLYIFAGFGAAGTGSVPLTTIVSNWFTRRRGLAIGIMSAGIGASGLIFSPIIGGVVIPAIGWRLGYVAIGLLLPLILIPLALLVMKTTPSHMGLAPYGGDSTVPSPVRRTLGGSALKTAVFGSAFWLISLSFFLGSAGQSALVQNQVPYLEDMGMSAGAAAAALGSVGLFSALGKFSFGWLCDRLNPRLVWAIAVSLQAVGAVCLLVLSNANRDWNIWLYAVAMGLGMGGWLPTMSIIVSSTFGLAAYGSIFGVVAFIFMVGQGLGPLLAGRGFDLTGSYNAAIIACLAGYAMALVAVLVLRFRPARH